MSENAKTTVRKKPSSVKTKKRIPSATVKKAVEDKSMPVQTYEGRIEFINHSRSVNVHVDRTSYYDDEIESVMLRPGESVFFTEKDLSRNKLQAPKFFTDGLLRRVEADSNVIEVINVRDDMSIPEIEAFVERADVIDPFERDLEKLNSLNTLNEVEEHCKKSNKTWIFIAAVENRKKEVNKKRKVG